MHKKKSSSYLLSLLILGILFRGLLGVFSAQAAGDPSISAWPLLQSGATPTFSATPTSTLLPAALSTTTPFSSSSSSVISPTGAVYTFVRAPIGYVSRPYVILTAFASIPRSEVTLIKGYIDSFEFVCAKSPCLVYLEGSARLVFQALTTSGGSSIETIASISVTNDQQGYKVTVDSVNQFTSFVDSCSLLWGVKDDENATWDSFVQFPYQLNTSKTLHTLAVQLLIHGVVDASDCPAGGLSVGLDWPTACGLEKVSGKMTQWQNQFDEYIWLASKESGIPPKVLKSLIELESQFWPGNSRFYLDEIGLGQVNQLGVDVLLRRDPTLYQKVCPGVLSDCSHPYLGLDESQQALIRGAVVNSVDSVCPNCEYGLDLYKAKDSISLIANLLKANCQQVDTILGDDISDATYEDLWRFTLGTYHSGVSCFQNAVNAVRKADDPITWENLEGELNCGRGGDYVNGLMDNLFVFDQYLYQATDAEQILVAPTLVPTRTPVPTPTSYISTASVKVYVYIDRNGNETPEPNEWIDGTPVLLTTSGGNEFRARTLNGFVVFDMTGFSPGTGIIVSLPGLYRSEGFILPEQGEVVIHFRFEQPSLPTVLP